MTMPEPPEDGGVSGWEQRRLSDLASFEKGRVVACVPNPENGTMPYIGADSFRGNFNQFTTDAAAVACETSDVLMLWDGERSGLCATGLRGAIGSTVARLRPKPSVNGRFLYHQLTRHFAWIQARRTGTGVPHVPKDLGATLVVPVPRKECEQSRIAAVLDTVDGAIAKTEAVIAKLKQVRAGLLHNFLTRGLDENGQVRDPIAHPEQFRESPLGEIPAVWKFDPLGIVCEKGGGSIQTGPFGSQLHASDYKDEGIPIITVEHLGENEILHDNLPLVGAEDYRRLQRYHLRVGDLVFSRVGAIDRCAFVSEDEEGWLYSGRCLRVRTGTGAIKPRFLSYQLNSYPCRRWIVNHSVGSTMYCLNTSILSQVPVLIPPPDEQDSLATILSTHDQVLRSEEQMLAKLCATKSGLMTDLLTGRVHVPENIIDGGRHI